MSVRRWIPAVAAALVLTAVSGQVLAQNDLLRDPVEFPDVVRSDIEPVDYAYRRGWFNGHDNGRFDPLGKLTPAHLVRVIDRAFPAGMTRAEFAGFLGGGEWEAGLTPGYDMADPIPMGQVWKVGAWDIRVLDVWPTVDDGNDIRQRGYDSSGYDNSKLLAFVEVEVVYRGTQSTGSFFDNLGYQMVSDQSFYGDGCQWRNQSMDGHVASNAVNVRPGVPVRGLLCRVVNREDDPHVMQIYKKEGSDQWAWFSLSSLAGGGSGLLRDPADFADVARNNQVRVDYAVRRGWFEGKADGRFDPLGPLTAAQLVRVIDRAFPDGMTRAEFAGFLGGGEWEAGLTPGYDQADPIPMGQVWRVGDWDIRFLEVWESNGWDDALRSRGYDRGQAWPYGNGAWRSGQLLLVTVEAVYRGTQATASFRSDRMGRQMASDLGFYTSDCVDGSESSTPGHLERVATDIRPGVPVQGLLCRTVNFAEDPNVMQIWDSTEDTRRWAWYSLW